MIEEEKLPQPLIPYQEKALTLVKKIGLPTKRSEQWRNSVPLVNNHFYSIAAQQYMDSITPTYLQSLDSLKLIFVDGYFVPDLSHPLPEEISFTSLAEAIKKQDSALHHIDGIPSPFQQGLKSLNSLLSRDGAILKIHKNASIDKPIHLIFKNITPNSTAYERVLIEAEANTKAFFIIEKETLTGQSENHVTEFFLDPNAHIKTLYVQSKTSSLNHYGSVSANLLKDSSLTLSYFHTSLGKSRMETVVNLLEAGAHASIGGSSFLSGTSSKDHVSFVQHKSPYCTSQQNFQSIGTAQTKSMVQSKSIVDSEAQKTEANQILRAYLLSDQAVAFAKPELEIYADDVKCSHGSTIGALDKEALYYMQTRGLPYEYAQALLTRSYMAEALEILEEPHITTPLLDHFMHILTENA